MYWLDFAIIYFALGAPFGVLRITAKRMATPFTFVRSVAGFLLWPLVAIRNVGRFLAEARTSIRASTPNASTSHNVSERHARHELDALRTEIEKALFPNAGASSDSAATRTDSDGIRNDSAAERRDLYAFRETFYRYTGLAEAVNAHRAVQNAQSDGFNSSLITHSSSLTRSACIARRDRQKLEAQLTQARSELIDLLESSNSAVEFARRIGDDSFVANNREADQ